MLPGISGVSLSQKHPVVEQRESRPAKQQRRHLQGRVSRPLSMDAEEMVVRQVGTDKIGLAIVAALLEAEQIGPEGVDPGKGKSLAMVPVIFAVIGQAITDVEAHHLDHDRDSRRSCRQISWPDPGSCVFPPSAPACPGRE